MNLRLSYRDIDLYDRDIELFHEGQWLNDSCISFCYKRIEDSCNEDKNKSRTSSRILLLDPSVVSFLIIQVSDEEDMCSLFNDLDLSNKLWIIAPINNKESFNSSSTHWSLLLYNTSSQLFYHLDSSRPYNSRAAIITAKKISELMKSEYKTVKEMNCPQQNNSYDCGVYTIFYSNYIYNYLLSKYDEDIKIESLVMELNNNFLEEQIKSIRIKSEQDILELSSKFEKRKKYFFLQFI